MESTIGYNSTVNVPTKTIQEGLDNLEVTQDSIRVDLEPWVKTILQKIDAENATEELRRVRKQTKMLRFYRGEQRGFFSNRGEWVNINPDDFEPHDSAVLLVNNQFRPMVKSLVKEWARSKTWLRCKPKIKDSIEANGAARFATGLISLRQQRLMPPSFRQRESKYATLCGNYFRYTCFDKNKVGGKVLVPKTSDKDLNLGQDYWWCPMCDKEGDTDKMAGNDQACPGCGSGAVQVEHFKPSQKVSIIEKYNKESIGDVDTDLVDPREVKIHLRARNISETPYLRRKRYIMVQVLKSMYPWAVIKPMTASPVMRYIQETELSTGSGTGSIPDGDYLNYAQGLGSMTEYNQVWIRPELYYNLEAKLTFKVGKPGSEKTINQGDKYIERFPNGLYVCISGDTILDIENESMDKYWSHGSFDQLTDSFWGDGLEDLMDQQSFLNEMQSLYIENVLYNASPKIIFNPHLIEAAMFSNHPSEMTPMARTSRRDDKPRESVYPIPGLSIAADVPLAMEKAVENMRLQSGATLSISGTNDPRLNTATAMAIARDSSIALLGPSLEIKSEVDVEWSYQILEHDQENWVDGYHNQLLGQYSDEEAKWFKECDIRNDLEIISEPGSWVPRTDVEIRNDFLAYLTAGGVPLGFANPQIPAEIREEASRMFRMPIDLNKIQPDMRNADIRINQIRAMADTLVTNGVLGTEDEDQGIASLIVNEIPVDVFIDDHSTMIDRYVHWRKTDAGRLAPKIAQMAVDIIIQEHLDATQKVKDYAFAQEARYQMAGQALMGMMQSGQEGASAQTQAQIQAQNQPQQPAKQGNNPVPVDRELPGERLATRGEERNQEAPVESV